ncbi:MAG: hypothetical protein ABMA64_35345, partial [Myxococcota bacterium]
MARTWFSTLPTDAAARWAAIRGFTHAWGLPTAPLPTEAALDAAAERLGGMPAALREVYRVFGAGAEALSGQDGWEPLEALTRRPDGRVVIRRENQSCEAWAVALDPADPPVIELGADRTSCPTLTEFVVQVLLLERGFTGWASVHGSVDDGWAARADAAMSRVPVSETYWVCTPLRIWEGPGAVLWTTES